MIDPTKVDPKTGKTNLELMQAGRAPLGPDGKPVNLHHLTQKQDGAIAEVTQTLHKDNHATLHMPNTVPSGIDRTQFNKWRRDYWKNRANDF
ncbi:HNH/ENDO VII family nuclease [Photobacterium sp. 1_MG-2023]|uniref:HNH/ENDO VII family nuclease n=1 Tax=Photobacterium sp. 1_MG-2023 TaxID=3062646 RepID=UPI0026E271FD|nr:HNH/ENDO VII family nuclease [Photobacterium sp. 1_MG-2023]MDO6708830.1 HNH/ENDO VII family nuclease [Photobacterium sp. 1_MG-2023]